MKLLVNGRQLILSQDLAARIGIEEALFLQQLHYRLDTQGVEKEGYFWYRQTYQGWAKQCFYWNITKVIEMFKIILLDRLIATKGHYSRLKMRNPKQYFSDVQKIS